MKKVIGKGTTRSKGCISTRNKPNSTKLSAGKTVKSNSLEQACSRSCLFRF